MAEIHMQQIVAAPPERVFAAITDHVAFGRWMHADIRVEREGTPAPNGLGAVRAVNARGLTVREEVVHWEAPRAMDYSVIAGAPLHDHRGEVRLLPDPAGTLIDYRIRFTVPWYLGGSLAGELFASILRREITAGLARLAAEVR